MAGLRQRFYAGQGRILRSRSLPAVERGRQVVQALLSEIRLYPVTENGKRRLEAELRGNMTGMLTLGSGVQKAPLMWLGEAKFDAALPYSFRVHVAATRWRAQCR